MLNVAGGQRIWLSTAPVDMRKSYDGLCALVRNHLRADPMDGHWHVFINRRRQQMKLLAFERGGFCLTCKRLEMGRLTVPVTARERRLALSGTAFLALLEGLDLVQTRQRKRFEFVPKKEDRGHQRSNRCMIQATTILTRTRTTVASSQCPHP